MLYNKINFRGHEGYITDRRVPQNERTEGYFYYDLRHEDDGCDPCSIEDFVLVNHWGTICFKESIAHILDLWGTNRLSTNLSEDEVEDIYTALDVRNQIEI